MKLLALKIILAILHRPVRFAYWLNCQCATKYKWLDRLGWFRKFYGLMDLERQIMVSERPSPDVILTTMHRFMHYLNNKRMMRYCFMRNLFGRIHKRYYQKLFGIK